MEGDANGAPHPDPSQYRSRFTRPCDHRLITGGIGHNLPQEAPAALTLADLASPDQVRPTRLQPSGPEICIGPAAADKSNQAISDR